MKRYRETDLFLWGDELYRLQEWADEHGDNILQKARETGTRTDGTPSGSVVLCPEMPGWLRKVSRAANKLHPNQQRAVKAYYSAQLVDGQRPNEHNIAIEIGMKIRDFKHYRRSGKIYLLKLLNSF